LTTGGRNGYCDGRGGGGRRRRRKQHPKQNESQRYKIGKEVNEFVRVHRQKKYQGRAWMDTSKSSTKKTKKTAETSKCAKKYLRWNHEEEPELLSRIRTLIDDAWMRMVSA
jgi:hypothetical protein